MAFVSKHMTLAGCSSDEVQRQARSLQSAANLVLLCGVLEEHRAIRCGRSKNIDAIDKKALPISGDGEQAGSAYRMETLLSDLLVFPNTAACGCRSQFPTFDSRLDVAAGRRASAEHRAARCPQPRHRRQRCQHHPLRRRGARVAPVAREARREPARGPQRQASGGARLVDRGLQPAMV